jgi:hypothetical protein
LEKDSHAKVQMRRKVRGLREIEKRMLADVRSEERVAETVPGASQAPSTAASSELVAASDKTPPADPDPSVVQREVVLDYCSAVRGILNDDQGGPLSPPGVRMDAALGDVQASIGRLLAPQKGGPATSPTSEAKRTRRAPARSVTSHAASSEAEVWSPTISGPSSSTPAR